MVFRRWFRYGQHKPLAYSTSDAVGHWFRYGQHKPPAYSTSGAVGHWFRYMRQRASLTRPAMGGSLVSIYATKSVTYSTGVCGVL